MSSYPQKDSGRRKLLEMATGSRVKKKITSSRGKRFNKIPQECDELGQALTL